MGNVDSKSLAATDDGMTTTSTTNKRSKDSKSNLDTTAASQLRHDPADDGSGSEKRESERAADLKRGENGSSKREPTSCSGGGPPLLPHPERLRDDQIHVNMAMADLMAYLQVVANNSNQLPLTRRDDPELDRTVSTLAAEDFARKSAAFVPADVRIMGGTFTRYGRVWDLPTSEEYNACDGAQEPGRSYGGAFCNTMLKVVYDAANEMDGAAQMEAAAQALFDDDDEEDEPSVTGGKSCKSGYSIDFGTTEPQFQITWAAMLRQLKSEFKDIGYSQVPKLTTTRKIDLNKPFSLTSEDFDKSKNKKRSLLIGCNYRNIEGAELKASHDDVRSMKDYIVNVHGFSEDADSMIILLDDENYAPPTFSNIVDAFKILSEESQPGDAVFVQFSGHGGRVLDAAIDSEAESYDEVIVPCDYEQTGLIRDTLIFKTLLAPMRYGVTLTILIDCCDTGMLVELPYAWNAKSDKRGNPAKLSMNEDFSFVRFLKVVKTLYESSTFTQLGKTVGSALNPLAAPSQDVQVDSDTRKNGKQSKNLKDGKKSVRSPNRESLYETFASACNIVQSNDSVRRDETTLSKDEQSTLTRKETLLETVIKGCSLLASPADDEFSDEDTFKTRTEDDQSFYSDGQSFESMTDDGYTNNNHDSRRRTTVSKRRH